MGSDTDVEKELRELSSALGLAYEPQDWGIVNANSGRLEEFIQHYEGQHGLSRTQRYELGELVLASANERLLSGPESLPGVFKEFVVKNSRALNDQLNYWSGLNDEQEFPLAKWLQVYGFART